MKKYTLLFLLYFIAGISLSAQDVKDDTIGVETKKEKYFKNTIRLNITNPLIFGKTSFVVGYERVFNEKFSASLNVGRTALPSFGILKFKGDSTLQLNKSTKDKGFHITGDFRYYPSTENKYAAPRGIYFGPYASYVTMGRENAWTLNSNNFNGDVSTDLNFSFFSVGAQLGYQFVIWKRIALDFVLLGPGIAFYELSAKIKTDLPAEDESALFERINEILEEKFPGYNFAFDGDFAATGRGNTTSLGYRYVVHLGFRF